MKSIIIIVIMSAVFIQPLFAGKLPAEDFKFVKQSNNVFLYERWIAAGNDEKVREIKAVFLVRASRNSLISLLKDPVKGRDWNVNAKEYRVLPLPEGNRWISYIQYDIPWPFDNQDCCLSFQSSESEVTFQSTRHSAFPEKDGIMRLTGTKGKWVLENMHSGNVKVTYFITTDRSRKIPRWVSDPIVHNNLIKTMTRFKTLAEQ
ncbi:hypothetical protein ACFOTA_17475 [Chitinophaga sp. GCM10012297]|uniref:START domain-containing protein n=1 Tax=Chitinophaga chungangae TaxID=2821488 RepID=A0ABS3YI89_9BACT|nr:hypothetical protein [Chitinophaga chungangae]MBO9154013.1 hypothetical protein [Chitinophaga chungangae]